MHMPACEEMLRDPARDDELVLVDVLDRSCGVASKERAHREGLLHRAFSVVLMREGEGGIELLLAQRAQGKYHSAGLWANSCCSHPRQGEGLEASVMRRLKEELGCEASGLHEIGSFVYRAPFENGLVEYEYDHVFVGHLASALAPDSKEVGGLRWVHVNDLVVELTEHPERFCAWAFGVLSLVLSRLTQS